MTSVDPKTAPVQRQLFGLNFNAVTLDEAVVLLAQAVSGRPARVVVTPNVDHLVNLEENAELKNTYKTADFVFADGMPVVWGVQAARRKPASPRHGGRPVCGIGHRSAKTRLACGR
jgi:UDP-N-acetyl-D-mannosaminuronic acid transferase (WecB/TagA/CpsF family)